MSADNITICPKCGEHRLREYCGIGMIIEADKKSFHIKADYRAECYECGFEYNMGEVILRTEEIK